MSSLSRKNNLAKNLNKMHKKLKKQYNFYPKTWNLPADTADFRQQFKNKTNITYIVKPEASC